jgi:hypothetical protein
MNNTLRLNKMKKIILLFLCFFGTMKSAFAVPFSDQQVGWSTVLASGAASVGLSSIIEDKLQSPEDKDVAATVVGGCLGQVACFLYDAKNPYGELNANQDVVFKKDAINPTRILVYAASSLIFQNFSLWKRLVDNFKAKTSRQKKPVSKKMIFGAVLKTLIPVAVQLGRLNLEKADKITWGLAPQTKVDLDVKARRKALHKTKKEYGIKRDEERQKQTERGDLMKQQKQANTETSFKDGSSTGLPFVFYDDDGTWCGDQRSVVVKFVNGEPHALPTDGTVHPCGNSKYRRADVAGESVGTFRDVQVAHNGSDNWTSIKPADKPAELLPAE